MKRIIPSEIMREVGSARHFFLLSIDIRVFLIVEEVLYKYRIVPAETMREMFVPSEAMREVLFLLKIMREVG